VKGTVMQDTPLQNNIEERDYRAGFERVMRFAEHARLRGWRLTDRQLVHEIIQRERAAYIREKSSLPVFGPDLHSAAYNRGQADALRKLLQTQGEQLEREDA
jgi:hypothetical protein